jgi:hypothetical protein
MKKIMSAALAGKILIGALLLLVLFHVLILFGVVPSDIVWGGQIDGSAANLLTLEMIAIVMTLVFITVVVLKLRDLKAGKSRILVNVGIWVIFAYLLLNTVGNFASGVSFESMVFGPITIILAFCALRLAIEK